MPGDFGLVYPLWNHSRQPGNLLDRVVGEVGLDHLTVPVVTGKMTQFRLTPGFESPYFHTEGGWHFPPQAKLYAAADVRPRPAKWFGTRDVLAEVKEVTQKLGLKLVLRLDLPFVDGLVDQAPQLRRRDAWGQERVTKGPCIVNPGFRELTAATLADLRRYEANGVVLRGIRPDGWYLIGGHLAAWTGIGGNGMIPRCFCAACRQAATLAGVDVDAALRSACAFLEHMRAMDPANPFNDRASKCDDNLASYDSARAAETWKWLEHLDESCGDWQTYLMHEAHNVRNLEQLDRVTSRRWLSLVRVDPVMLFPGNAGPALFESFRRANYRGISLSPWMVGGPGADALVQFVSGAVTAGAEFVDFEDLEASPDVIVTWIKQAVRYARRG